MKMLYAGKWHTVVGPTECGKSWLGLHHCVAEMDRGNTVVYIHFEEATPSGTLDRLMKMGVTREDILARFKWMDSTRAFRKNEMADELGKLEVAPALVVLDGINAACTMHGKDPKDVDAVGWYRMMFVAPATRLGAAVMSMGHPVKDQNRQMERHSYGSTAWLDEADGVAFRMRPGAPPVRRGATEGSASVYVVKDRYGEVARHGLTPEDGWTYWAQMYVADHGDRVDVRLLEPAEGEGTTDTSPIKVLADEITTVLELDGPGFPTVRGLQDMLAARQVRYDKTLVGAAIRYLVNHGRLTEVRKGQARGGELS